VRWESEEISSGLLRYWNEAHKMRRSTALLRVMPMKSKAATGNPSVRLVAPRAHHAKMWFAWRSEPLAQRYMPIEPWTVSALKKRLLASEPDLADEEKQEHRWIVQYGRKSVGIVAVLRPVFRQRHAEISYHLAEAHQGKGIGTEAVTLLVANVFEQTDFTRLFAYISISNRASRALAEKLGFVHEGTLRSHFIIRGRLVDQCVYGLLRKDWQRKH
jgi:[ribosomal protein S5]-alanine N-acetyltransferase